MSKQAMADLENFTSSSEFLLSDERIRSIVFVRNSLWGNTLSGPYRTHQNGNKRHIFAVTDLLENNQYLVEPLESGYRLYFQLNGAEVMVEVASEADVSNVGQDLGRRLVHSDAQSS